MFFIGDFYTYKGKELCVTLVDTRNNKVALADKSALEIKRKGRKPAVYDIAKLKAEFAYGKLLKIDGDLYLKDAKSMHDAMNSMNLAFDSRVMVKSESERIKRRMAIIAAFVNDPELMHGYIFGNLSLSDYAKKNGLKKGVLTDNLHRYFALGSTPYAFIDRYTHARRRSQSATKSYKKRGPKPTELSVELGNEAHKAFEPSDEAKMLKLFTNKELKLPQYSSHDLYAMFLERYYLETDDENSRLDYWIQNYKPIHPSEIISLRTFRYHFKRLFPKETLLLRRKGLSHYRNNIEACPGHAGEGVGYAGQIYEIDSTPLDVYVYATEQIKQLGVLRPTLYLMIDVYSRYIVGAYISMKSERLSAIQQILFMAFTNKVEFCKKNGMIIDAHEWAETAIPSKLVQDNGSAFICKEMAAHTDALGITFTTYVRVASGSEKPYVERSNQSIQNKALLGVKGRIQKELPRGEKAPKDCAEVSYDQLMKSVLRAVMMQNNCARLDVHPDKDLALLGKKPTASEVYVKSRKTIEVLSGRRELTEEQVRVALLPTSTASMSNEYISFQGRKYISSDPIVLAMMTKTSPQVSGSKPITVYYSSNSIDIIWLRHFVNGQLMLIPLKLSSKNRYLSGLNYWQASVTKKLRAEYNKGYELTSKINTAILLRENRNAYSDFGIKRKNRKNTITPTAVRDVLETLRISGSSGHSFRCEPTSHFGIVRPLISV